VIRLVRRRTAASDERGWDPPSGRIEEGALAGAEAVVNFCGAGIADKRWTEARKQVLRDSRTIPTEVLATEVARVGVPVLLNASAVGYYGDTGDRTVDETALRGSGFLAGLCEEWEAATAPAVEAGSRVVLFRNGVVFAPQGGMLTPLVRLYSWLLGGRLGSGRQYMPWISLDDHLAAIQFLLAQESISGPVNLTGPVPATNTEFNHAMGNTLHRPAPWAVPSVALRIALGEVADELLLASQRVVPAVLQRHGFAFTHESVQAALKATLRSRTRGV
jgi:hypothetical protein